MAFIALPIPHRLGNPPPPDNDNDHSPSDFAYAIPLVQASRRGYVWELGRPDADKADIEARIARCDRALAWLTGEIAA